MEPDHASARSGVTAKSPGVSFTAMATSWGIALNLGSIIVDRDEFRSMNDRFDHEAGDRALEDVPAILRASLRAASAPPGRSSMFRTEIHGAVPLRMLAGSHAPGRRSRSNPLSPIVVVHQSFRMNKAPSHWYGHAQVPASEAASPADGLPSDEPVEIGAAAGKKAWARLLAKIYEADPFLCPNCGGRMAVIAVIQDVAAIQDIIGCLAGKGRGPPR